MRALRAGRRHGKSSSKGLRERPGSFADTLLSLNVDLDPEGYLEDLGLILEVLGVMVSSI